MLEEADGLRQSAAGHDAMLGNQLMRARVILPSVAGQCANGTGTVMLASSVRLAPPNTISRSCEWP